MYKYSCVLLVLLSLLAVGCQNSYHDPFQINTPATPNKMGKDEIKQDKQQSKRENKDLSYIGLGGKLEAFEKEYGKNKGTDMLGKFSGGSIMPTFADGRAILITINFPTPYNSKAEALTYAKTFIPKDSRKIKEYLHTELNPSDRYVIVYNSKLFSEMLKEAGANNPSVEKFVLILKKENGKYIGATLGLGDNP